MAAHLWDNESLPGFKTISKRFNRKSFLVLVYLYFGFHDRVKVFDNTHLRQRLHYNGGSFLSRLTRFRKINKNSPTLTEEQLQDLKSTIDEMNLAEAMDKRLLYEDLGLNKDIEAITLLRKALSMIEGTIDRVDVRYRDDIGSRMDADQFIYDNKLLPHFHDADRRKKYLKMIEWAQEFTLHPQLYQDLATGTHAMAQIREHIEAIQKQAKKMIPTTPEEKHTDSYGLLKAILVEIRRLLSPPLDENSCRGALVPIGIPVSEDVSPSSKQ